MHLRFECPSITELLQTSSGMETTSNLTHRLLAKLEHNYQMQAAANAYVRQHQTILGGMCIVVPWTRPLSRAASSSASAASHQHKSQYACALTVSKPHHVAVMGRHESSCVFSSLPVKVLCQAEQTNAKDGGHTAKKPNSSFVIFGVTWSLWL